jgi:capsular polysaccharide transport system permease protein
MALTSTGIVSTGPTRLLESLREHGRILVAVAIMDMKTRFGRSMLAYLVAIGWPLSHMLTLLLGYLMSHRIAPIGDDPAVFAGSGLVPYVLCLYPARNIMMAVIQNQHLLRLQLIKPLHLILGRTLLEIPSTFVVCIIFYGMYLGFDVDFVPTNLASAAGAILASICLGIGIGTFGTILAAVFGPFSVIAVVLILITLYLTAGIFLPIDFFPSGVHEVVYYNPIYHCVQWLRSSYYLSIDEQAYSPAYVALVAASTFALGLLGERFLRGRYY